VSGDAALQTTAGVRQDRRRRRGVAAAAVRLDAPIEGAAMKGQQKPKQLAKKTPQKTLKEKRAAKKAK
jgi:hypothetical protein